ncbi:MAG: MCE family protein [Streptosporangiaceae bacterium]|nr:MCE family protein [Streptosporangiaceae bacterium]MBV9856230.1 MCE family protein [Streptosporangiaceae bacterium]
MTRVKLVVFAVLAVAVIAYTGLHYASIGRYFGVPGYYVVKADLPSAGGLYVNADVTYRGVSVGRVGALTLAGSGVQAELNISNSAPPIPADSQLVVADLSAVGEQYADLRPGGASSPYLTAGDTISAADTQVPAPVTDVLASVDALARSLPLGSLRTVVSELYNGFSNQGPNLQSLLDNSSSFTQAAIQALTPTTRLIQDGQSVLATQQAETNAIETFASQSELLAQQLNSSDSDLRRLLASGPLAAEQVSGLLQDNDPDLGLLLANLLSTAQVTAPRQSALKELLSALPAVVAAGNTVINARGANFGLALTFFNPLPCTAGYQGTVYRNGTDASAAPPLNTAAYCASPASSGIDVRGSAHAPSP